MHFEILDPNVSTTMNVFIIIGNIISLCQNVPQVIKTYKVKSTRDFSSIFLLMRVSACLIWGAYSIEIESLMMLINNLITLSATGFIGYYKIKEIRSDYIIKNHKTELTKYMEIQNNDSPLEVKL
jgi:uncharacterized protein with PQ loop repeat